MYFLPNSLWYLTCSLCTVWCLNLACSKKFKGWIIRLYKSWAQIYLYTNLIPKCFWWYASWVLDLFWYYTSEVSNCWCLYIPNYFNMHKILCEIIITLFLFCLFVCFIYFTIRVNYQGYWRFWENAMMLFYFSY